MVVGIIVVSLLLLNNHGPESNTMQMPGFLLACHSGLLWILQLNSINNCNIIAALSWQVSLNEEKNNTRLVMVTSSLF